MHLLEQVAFVVLPVVGAVVQVVAVVQKALAVAVALALVQVQGQMQVLQVLQQVLAP